MDSIQALAVAVIERAVLDLRNSTIRYDYDSARRFLEQDLLLSDCFWGQIAGSVINLPKVVKWAKSLCRPDISKRAEVGLPFWVDQKKLMSPILKRSF